MPVRATPKTGFLMSDVAQFYNLYLQVRKTSQAALLVLLEGELVDRGMYLLTTLAVLRKSCVYFLLLCHKLKTSATRKRLQPSSDSLIAVRQPVSLKVQVFCKVMCRKLILISRNEMSQLMRLWYLIT